MCDHLEGRHARSLLDGENAGARGAVSRRGNEVNWPLSMSKLSRTLLMAFAALGLGAASVSSYVHYHLLTDPGYSSFCDVNATVNCTQAYLSSYGSLWGVPVALFGVFLKSIDDVRAITPSFAGCS